MIKGYMTRYALTRGIEAVTVVPSSNNTDERVRYCYTVGEDGEFHGTRSIQLVVGKTFFESRSEAEEDARAQARRKLKNLELQVERMRQLANSPLWADE